MEKVLVTGACGFIGKQLISELLNRGKKIIAVDIKFDDSFFNNSDIRCIDITDTNLLDLEKQLKNEIIDCIFHLAWVGTSGPLREDYAIQLNNVKLACDCVVLASRIGCNKFLYASSINEIETYEYLQSDDISPGGGYIYGTGKLAAHLMGETVAKLNNIDFISILITNIYGAGENSARLINTSIRKLLNKEHCSFTEGFQIYDFIYITDAINSIIEVAEKGNPFNRYYIGSGKPRPLRDFLLEMKDIVDPTAKLGFGDLPFNGININYNQFKLKKVEEDTGYINRVNFKDGIKKTLDYIRQENQ